jgi:hypothetical protein
VITLITESRSPEEGSDAENCPTVSRNLGQCDDNKLCPRVWIKARPQHDGSEELRVVRQGYRVRGDGPLAAPPDGERQIDVDLATDQRLDHERDWLVKRGDPFQDFNASAFRLETLQHYDVERERERFDAFQTGRPLPPRTPDTSPWLRRLQASTAAGKRWQRVHLVTQPLTPYLRFELPGYQESAAVGYETWIADLGLHPGLQEVGPDFWLYDAETEEAVLEVMCYDARGRFQESWRTIDAATVQMAREVRDLALKCGEPLAAFVARVAQAA